MRFERIELPAFGPFTDFALDLSERPAALHVVYGANEAGKSSLLRALTALLYGVPARSPDGHLHDFARLRVAAALRTPSGELLHVVRRKGNKHTLLDRDEKPLPDNVLTPLLGGLDEPLFSSMFGLDHERLRAGAEALLHGGGHVGEGLFDAGSGARAIRLALESLRVEAEELYKPRGRTPKLNVSVELLREQRRKLRDAALSPQVYADQQKAIAEALSAREAAALRRRAVLTEQAKLSRQLALAPLLAQHAELSREHARLVNERAEDRAARSFESSELCRELRQLEQRLATCQAFRSEQPERAAALSALEREVSRLRGRLGAVAACESELDTPARTRLRRLAERERALANDQTSLERELLAERERLARVDTRLAELAPTPGGELVLAELVERVAKADTVAELGRLRSEIARETAHVERGLAQLSASITVVELARLPLPSEASLSELEAQHAESDSELRRVREAERAIATHRASLSQRRAELLAEGELASDRDLERVHAERARAFAELVAAWRAGEPFSLERVHGYERALRESDELAARMRAEARRYAEFMRCEAERARLEEEQRVLAAELTQQQALRERLAAETVALARSLGLRATEQPRELRSKVHKLVDLVARAERVESLTCERGRLGCEADAQAEALVSALASAGQTVEKERGLALALASARAALTTLRERDAERRLLQRQRDELLTASAVASAKLSAVHAAQTAEREQFGRELASHALAPALSADELLACLDDLALLAHAQRQLTSQREQVARMEQSETELCRDIERVAASSGLAVAGVSPAQALALLAERERAWRETTRELERTTSELAAREQQLREHGEGASIEQLRASLLGFDPDLGRARKGELDSELEQLTDSLRELDQRLGALRAGLARLEEPSSAVELAEQTECELASARTLSRRYVELRLAAQLLTREIERYRAEHQGPVLARASALFPRLTLGRYLALEVDYDERDEPVLACVKQGGKRVHVLGLSDGTRDQLYLALRIASIERFLALNVALPLILDDAFVHFDDARAEAALSVLGELAERTQVLFFTHHTRMVELARRALGPQRVVVHELDPQPPALPRDHGPLFA